MSVKNRPLFRGQDPWAKTTDRTARARGFALHTHLSDVAGVVDTVVDRWVSPGVESDLSRELGANLRDMVRLCALAHDIGKASPFFQHLVPHLSRGMPDATLVEPYVPHNLVSGFAVRQWLCGRGFSRAARLGVELVVSGHHGRFPSERTYPSALRLEHDDWQKYRDELMDYLTDVHGVDVAALAHVRWSPHTVAAVCGLVIVCDWLGSDTSLFPTDAATECDYGARRASALSRMDLGGVWHPRRDPECGWASRFGLPEGTDLHAMQRAVVDSADGGLTIVEHETGGGKTAAALLAAEKIAHAQGKNGIYVALPTRTVANAMFSTVTDWLAAENRDEPAPTVAGLVHGKAERDSRFQDVVAGAVGGVEYNVWFHRKRGPLTPVAVGTIDHVLMCGLKTPHVVLRHVGLLSKVLVIDEVHSSDTYMETYLDALVSWCGAYGVPVIALSATLSARRRELLVNAYRRGQGHSDLIGVDVHDTALSRITRVTPAGTVSTRAIATAETPRDVALNLVGGDPDFDAVVADVDAGGGVVALVATTVTRAQRWYASVRERAADTDVEVVLLHSRFTDTDRMARERDLVARCGRGGVRPDKLIVVSTQVIEQALDLDFDSMTCDVAPADVLIQRAGRVHRHTSTRRPEHLCRARMNICGVEGTHLAPGIDRVYSPLLVYRTLAWLRKNDTLTIPFHVPSLMRWVFDTTGTEGVDLDVVNAIDTTVAVHEARERDARDASLHGVLPDVREKVHSVFDWSWSSTHADDSAPAVRAPDGSCEVELELPTGADMLRIPRWYYTSAWLKQAPRTRGGTPQVTPDDAGYFDLGRGRLRYDHELGLIADAA